MNTVHDKGLPANATAVTIRIDADLVAAIKARATANDRTFSAEVRRILREATA